MNTPHTPASTGWLDTLSELSLGDFEMSPDLDAKLSALALRARTDRVACEELFVLLAFKTARFCRRFRGWSLAPWTYDDIVQEAFLAFDDLLRVWKPIDSTHGPAGFGFYYLRVYPLRLTDRVRAILRTRRDAPTILPWDPGIDVRHEPGNPLSDIETQDILQRICGHLNAADATILLGRVAGNDDMNVVAAAAGVSRRTLYRRWKKIAAIAERELTGTAR